MKFDSNIRSFLLAGAAVSVIAACSDAEVVTPGESQITVVVPGGGTGGGGGTFATRSTAPTGQADCPAGSTFVSNVDVLGSGVETTFCALTAIGGGTITGTVDIPLSADPILISGTVFVGDGTAGSADLTVAAGQTFVSRSDGVTIDTLVISAGSTATIQGTANAPIVFTSMEDFDDDGLPNGTSGTSEWGGLAINGTGQLNECTVDPSATPGTAACQQVGEGGSGTFGGDGTGTGSGTFEYIRVQHAGFPFTPTNELNSIALQGTEDGTVINHVQVHRGADDGIEWFGGDADLSNVVITGAGDDSLDWTDGWSGALQFALVVQEDGDDNGIEGDNNGDTDADAAPRSMPNVSNVTLIGDGPGSGEGMQLRAGTAGNFFNMVITNFDQGLEFNQEGTGPDPVTGSIALTGNDDQFAGDGEALFNAGTNNIAFPSSTLDGVIPGINEDSITAADPTAIDPFFVAADYAGAFGGTDTNASNWTTGWTVSGSIPGSTTVAGCPTGTTLSTDTPGSEGFGGRTETRICDIDNPVSGDVVLNGGNLYRFTGTTFIGVDAGADPAAPSNPSSSLTVDPGVTLYGAGEGAIDLLIVSRGSQIFVNGSPVAPVVLTSRQDLENGGVLRAGATSEVGGLSINGRAPLNECTVDPSATGGAVDCEQTGEGGSGVFGGATADDDSGRINYLQVRYAGFPFTPTNELNSIALQGVGSGTEIDFVQIINGADDGIEWFGGTVDASHVIVTGAGDDSLDWTDGWTGALQFAIVRQNAGDDNGIEGDNNGDTDADALPRSAPSISNVTLIGDDDGSGEGIQLRAGTSGNVINTIVRSFDQNLEINLEGTGPNPVLNGLILQRTSATSASFAGDGATEFAAATNSIEFGAGVAGDSTLTNAPGTTTPLIPGVNEQAGATGATSGTDPLGAAVDPSSVDARLSGAAYFGAVENASDTWFVGWTLGL
ncbi:MAG: hypothetical protein AAFV51_08215 [Pseudomonadota bacterium]